MISIDKVNALIIEKIQAVLPKVSFTAQEKLEEIERPAFKLVLDEVQSERFSPAMVRRVFPVELDYFAKDVLRPKLECLEILEKIEPVLLGLAEKIKANLVSADGVIFVEFEVTQIDELAVGDEDPGAVGSGEDMEKLEMEEELWQ